MSIPNELKWKLAQETFPDHLICVVEKGVGKAEDTVHMYGEITSSLKVVADRVGIWRVYGPETPHIRGELVIRMKDFDAFVANISKFVKDPAFTAHYKLDIKGVKLIRDGGFLLPKQGVFSVPPQAVNDPHFCGKCEGSPFIEINKKQMLDMIGKVITQASAAAKESNDLQFLADVGSLVISMGLHVNAEVKGIELTDRETDHIVENSQKFAFEILDRMRRSN